MRASTTWRLSCSDSAVSVATAALTSASFWPLYVIFRIADAMMTSHASCVRKSPKRRSRMRRMLRATSSSAEVRSSAASCAA